MVFMCEVRFVSNGGVLLNRLSRLIALRSQLQLLMIVRSPSSAEVLPIDGVASLYSSRRILLDQILVNAAVEAEHNYAKAFMSKKYL